MEKIEKKKSSNQNEFKPVLRNFREIKEQPENKL